MSIFPFIDASGVTDTKKVTDLPLLKDMRMIMRRMNCFWMKMAALIWWKEMLHSGSGYLRHLQRPGSDT